MRCDEGQGPLTAALQTFFAVTPCLLFSDVESDMAAFRLQNPKLKVLASLGGQAVKASTFSSFITNIESLNNLTSSINGYYRDGLLDGVEIDWEWPFQEGGKKDRIKLIRYARVSFTQIF